MKVIHITYLQLQSIPRTRSYKLLSPLNVMLDDERTIVVPDGFETDLISSPRWLWSFIPPADKGKEAAVLHDYLLSQGIPRKICDRHFYAALEWLGQKTVKKWCMYYGVRLYSLFVKAKTGK